MLSAKRSASFTRPEEKGPIELAPQNAAATASLGGLLSSLGRFDEAVALAPLRAASHAPLAGDLAALGRYDEAEAAVRKAIALQPQSATSCEYLAIIQISARQSRVCSGIGETGKRSVLAHLRTGAGPFADGDPAEADAALKKLIDEYAGDAGSQIAQVYALRKEPEKMFEWLEHAWKTHDAGVTDLLDDPFLRAYKDDPRFIAFAQKVGVMPKAAAQP